jgi:hypothetical protein
LEGDVRLSCAGCKFYRQGRCSDWTVQALLGGDPIADDMERKCYEPLNEETEVDSDAECVKGAIMSREAVANGIIPDGEASHAVKCRYCGTECADVDARDGHEPLCDQNPASLNWVGRPKAPVPAAKLKG